MSQAEAPPDRPLRVLVVLAHPDDPEFFCGGTVARWASEGREIYYCLLTRGDKGADDPGVDPAELAETREREQRAAAATRGPMIPVWTRLSWPRRASVSSGRQQRFWGSAK